jgi:hypothetical protein
MTEVRHEVRHPREAIDAALALVHQGHTTKANAVDAANKSCGVMDPQAVAWRLATALMLYPSRVCNEGTGYKRT